MYIDAQGFHWVTNWGTQPVIDAPVSAPFSAQNGFQTGTSVGLTGTFPAGTNFVIQGGIITGTY